MALQSVRTGTFEVDCPCCRREFPKSERGREQNTNRVVPSGCFCGKPLENGQMYVTECNRKLHSKCMAQLALQCAAGHVSVKCPYCLHVLADAGVEDEEDDSDNEDESCRGFTSSTW